MKYIYHNLGCGDHLLCNAIVRSEAAKNSQVLVASWWHNRKSVEFMYRDLPNVQVFVVKSDEEAKSISERYDSLLLGFHNQPFDCTKFDQEFYRQAGMDFEERWNGFKVIRNPELEVKLEDKPFWFVHDDPKRGFWLTKLPTDERIWRPTQLSNIFQFMWMLENAEEIHCINSSFLILADSIPTKANKLVFHWYARKTDYPRLKKNWQILE